MKMWQIKVTHLEGPFKGKYYILTKGGYVSQVEKGYVWPEDCYKTLGGCKRVCRAKQADNELSVSIEKKNRQMRTTQGLQIPEYPIYELEAYEPYEVEFAD